MKIGIRNAPALFNLAWQKEFMWDREINKININKGSMYNSRFSTWGKQESTSINNNLHKVFMIIILNYFTLLLEIVL